MGQPILRVAVHEAVGLGAGVVLVDHRSEPLDHLLLDRHRTRRCGVDDTSQRRDVVAGANLGRQLEQADEHRRHDLDDRHAVALDEGEELLGVEALHQHGGAAEGVGAHHEAQRGGVVHRRRRQVDVVRRDAEEQPQEQCHAGGGRLQWAGAELHRYALRSPGRSRRVEHVGAGDTVWERRRVLSDDALLIGCVSLDRAVEHQP